MTTCDCFNGLLESKALALWNALRDGGEHSQADMRQCMDYYKTICEDYVAPRTKYECKRACEDILTHFKRFNCHCVRYKEWKAVDRRKKHKKLRFRRQMNNPIHVTGNKLACKHVWPKSLSQRHVDNVREDGGTLIRVNKMSTDPHTMNLIEECIKCSVCNNTFNTNLEMYNPLRRLTLECASIPVYISKFNEFVFGELRESELTDMERESLRDPEFIPDFLTHRNEKCTLNDKRVRLPVKLYKEFVANRVASASVKQRAKDIVKTVLRLKRKR